MGRLIRSGLRVLLLSVGVCGVLLATTLCVAGLIALFTQRPITSGATLYLGLVCALIVWLFVATMHLRRQSLAVPVLDQPLFFEKIRLILSEMGYAMVSLSANQLVMKPRFQSYLLGGGIQVKVDDLQAKITGPKVLIELVRNHLRLQQHLEKMQMTSMLRQKRNGEKKLKRIQLTFKLDADQVQAVERNVVQVLAKEANVSCVLDMMVQSDEGIPEHVFNYQIRDWLERNGLCAEIQRDRVEWVDAPHLGGMPTLFADYANSEEKDAESETLDNPIQN